MRLRVTELLEKQGWTAYRLAQQSDGRISLSTAYRLARGEVTSPSTDLLDALCDVFKIKDPGPLFARD